ncbi:MAG: hypothetical protein WBE08_09275 [Methyloceanibacter sp.]|jgi:hypothetical protein
MFHSAKFLALALLMSLVAAPALALPAPMSEQDLNAMSDLVAELRVLSVSCTGVTKDAASGEELPSYLAKVRLLTVKKGEAKAGDEVLITWRSVPKGALGPWTVNYYPGEVVTTHLTKKSGGVSYGSTWWNAKGDDVQAPESTELPATLGETFVAPQEPGDQRPL